MQFSLAMRMSPVLNCLFPPVLLLCVLINYKTGITCIFSNVLNPSFDGDNRESETSSYSWQVIAFHLKCCGLERGREARPLILHTGFNRNGSGDS